MQIFKYKLIFTHLLHEALDIEAIAKFPTCNSLFKYCYIKHLDLLIYLKTLKNQPPENIKSHSTKKLNYKSGCAHALQRY